MLLEDVNLSEIQITSDGKNINFNFLDMYEGKPIASMTCKNVMHFIYSNTFDDNDYGFACYAGEVTLQSFTSHEDIVHTLGSMKYRFKKCDMYGNALGFEPMEELHLVGIEGGEVSIAVLCKKLPTLQRLE